ncbi:Putative tRNA wybutosine synthesizing protein [Septoria linicola]|uniref:tRNA wybutosine-synthesizing protein 2 n=1 Tax=Septoria linicola TaxID=215465 RepID=A0A9Q9AXT1_9PEZI|nr:Putative tRNA wybutosine synthesizing protein [Septoria linicola]
MDRAVERWRTDRQYDKAVIAPLAKKLCKSYTVYGCMLLLPHNALEGPEWTALGDVREDAFQELHKLIAKELKVTHIASNKPIPPQDLKTSSENILRAPINFTPLYGDFGPETCSQPPTEQDFDKAFWVTAKQNGIYQVWAPRWTMFSRGNISEKARLLALPSVTEAVEDDDEFGVVDLYAGIGYFAFSYIKAGADKVYCWDINPWSIEGLLRGAKANKWKAVLYGGLDGSDENPSDIESIGGSDAKLLVFNESNELAPKRLNDLTSSRPRIRHVNLGMLPSSRKALELAAAFVCLRPRGWLHVHENFLVEEIQQKAKKTREEFEQILVKSDNLYVLQMEEGQGVKVEVEHINRLKSYSPGVMHCVIDIAVEIRGQ